MELAPWSIIRNANPEPMSPSACCSVVFLFPWMRGELVSSRCTSACFGLTSYFSNVKRRGIIFFMCVICIRKSFKSFYVMNEAS